MSLRWMLIGVGASLALAVAVLWPRAFAKEDRFAIALSLLAEGRGADAALLFDDPVWRGVAEYRAGRYARAAAAFGEAEDAMALYNLGNAQAQLGAWPEARRAYLAALRLEPDHDDALHNLDLVTAAEALEEDLAEAQRQMRQATGVDNAAEAINKKGETATEDPDGGSRRSVGDVDASEDASQWSGNARRTGRASERNATETATGATAVLRGGGADAEATADGTGAAIILRDSAQAAEILLRRIKDDPARVLRARLRAAHAARRERAEE